MSNLEPITPGLNEILPFNIGIAPAGSVVRVIEPPTEPEPNKLILAGSPSGKTFDGPSKLVFANGSSVNGDVPAEPLVGTDGEPLNSLTWPAYLAWRKTKTRHFDYERCPPLAVRPTDPARPLSDAFDLMRERGVEEIQQGTMEMIGEVAELGELFMEAGPTTFWGEGRDKLIDECGDILFCASWALDAWGLNPLNEADDLEMIRISEDNELADFAAVIGQNELKVALANPRFVSMLGGLIFNLLLTAQTNAGLTANSYKKLRFQNREQSVETQVERIARVLIAVNQILIVANSSVEEALKVNMRKLDARRPKGYDPAVPGGIRTGEGK
jgi:hypothetical protein